MHALAQNPAGGVVEGMIFDSVSMRSIPRATVQLSRRDSSPKASISSVWTATTDERGRFRFDSLAPGRYIAGFFHESLDSLGIEAPLREVRITGRGPYRLTLAIPSAKAIIGALCGPTAVSDSTGLLIGFVRHARTSAAIDSASVIVHWTRLVIGKERVSLEHPEVAARTRGNGWYALCNVPVGWPILLTATSGGDSSGVVETSALARELTRADLYVGESEPINAAPSPIRPASTPRDSALRRGPARLTVTVRTAAGRPIADAQVRIPATPSNTSTNESGTAALTDLPAGSQVLDVRAIGYVPVRQTIHLLIRDAFNHAEVVLTSVQTYLDTVRVTAGRVYSRDATGFERRRRTGLGRFIDRGDIDRQRPFRTSDLLRMMPSVYVEPGTFGSTVWMRGTGGGHCRPAVFLDGVRFGREFGDIDVLTIPNELEAIEVYVRSAQAPGQFMDMHDGCGSVVLWSRRRWPTPRR